MANYVTTNNIKALLPEKFIVQSLDDDKDGLIDPDVEGSLLTAVTEMIDGYLGARYEVPFQQPYPAIVLHAARVFYIESLYIRRGTASDKVSWCRQADELRKRLERIGNGEEPLTPEIQRAKPSGVFITEPSKTFSKNGRTAF